MIIIFKKQNQQIMSLPIFKLMENFGVPKDAKELITLNEPFDWNNTGEAILELESHVDELNITTKSKKQINKIVTETLDNVCRHAIQGESKLSCFSCKIHDNKIFVATRNLIQNNQVGQILMMIEDLNSSDKDELNERYRHQLKNGKLDDGGNAGLGFLEIARRTNDMIRFNFESNEVKDSYFTLFLVIETEN